jgi:hypothetical protein
MKTFQDVEDTDIVGQEMEYLLQKLLIFVE